LTTWRRMWRSRPVDASWNRGGARNERLITKSRPNVPHPVDKGHARVNPTYVDFYIGARVRCRHERRD
jgi:hypothetical protein